MVDACVIRLAESIATQKGLSDVDIDAQPGSKKGDGFLGDIFTVSVKNGKKNLEMIFKCAMTDEQIVSKYHIKELYDNELRFYTTIIPTLKKWEKETGVEHRFTAVAKYLGSLYENDIRIIAMENLRKQGFELFSKKATVNGDHVSMVFAHYARFHAFSFAYREQHPEQFAALVEPLENLWYKFAQQDHMKELINDICKSVPETELESEVREKFRKYLTAGQKFPGFTQYHGKYSAILHGDCWSNNMMFKYKDVNGKKQLADMCFLDWQICKVGTPVFDLSYFLYSSSSKEVFDNLDHYLKVYHDSFSTTLREMGGDPEKLFPISALKADWKEYCKFGFILGLLLQRMKLIKDDEIKDLRDIKDDKADEVSSKFLDSSFNKDVFDERAKNLIIHMYEIGAL